MSRRLRSVAASARQGRRNCATLARRGRTWLATAAFLVFAGNTSVFACPMCFGAEESTLIDGTKLGILVLLGITLAVQGAFAGFFFYLRSRARRMAEADLDSEWSELQGASRTS